MLKVVYASLSFFQKNYKDLESLHIDDIRLQMLTKFSMQAVSAIFIFPLRNLASTQFHLRKLRCLRMTAIGK